MNVKTKVKVNIVQDPDAPVERSVLAADIGKISHAMHALLKSGLTRRAIVVLVHDACKGNVGKPAIEDVLSALETLKERYTR